MQSGPWLLLQSSEVIVKFEVPDGKLSASETRGLAEPLLLILPVVPSDPVDPSLPAIAADPAGTVAVEPAAVDAGEVAVATGAGDVDVGLLVGVVDSPAHASATMSMSPARVAIIGLTLYPFRDIACHSPG